MRPTERGSEDARHQLFFPLVVGEGGVNDRAIRMEGGGALAAGVVEEAGRPLNGADLNEAIPLP